MNPRTWTHCGWPSHHALSPSCHAGPRRWGGTTISTKLDPRKSSGQNQPVDQPGCVKGTRLTTWWVSQGEWAVSPQGLRCRSAKGASLDIGSPTLKLHSGLLAKLGILPAPNHPPLQSSISLRPSDKTSALQQLTGPSRVRFLPHVRIMAPSNRQDLDEHEQAIAPHPLKCLEPRRSNLTPGRTFHCDPVSLWDQDPMLNWDALGFGEELPDLPASMKRGR